MKLTMEQAANYSGVVLAPIDDSLESVPSGEVMVDIHKNRNVKNHRRYFAFVRTSFAMQDHYENEEQWRKVLQLKAGHYDLVVTEKGKNLYLPKSINWDQLDETEFRPLFNDVVNAFIKDFGDKLDEYQINAILEY